MSFSTIIQKKYKILLPLSFLYKLGIKCHHFLYSSGIKKQYTAALPTICVGNLSVGGTGKTPMVEKLISILKNEFSIAVISRGYHRKSKGLIIADKNTTVYDVGDEPYQYFSKYKNIQLAVAEKRIEAIQFFEQKGGVDVIILDDALQHLAILPGFTIMLTKYNNLFYKDYYLPAGELRDLKKNYKKANIIVITKCPETLTMSEADKIIHNIYPQSYQQIFFASLDYDDLKPLFEDQIIEVSKKIILVTGIAHAQSIVKYLKNNFELIHHFEFSDHHSFSVADIQNITSKWVQGCSIITTEKDATKLLQFKKELSDFPIFVLPVTHKILFEKEKSFQEEINNYITRL